MSNNLPFQIGGSPNPETIAQDIRDLIAKEDRENAERIVVSAERLPDSNLVRVVVRDSATGHQEIADIKYGAQIGQVGPSVNIMYHGRSPAVIGTQIEGVKNIATGRYSFNAISPVELFTRGMVEAVISKKPFTEIMSVGVPGKIAPHGYDENDDFGIPIAGKMMGVAPYASDSLQTYLNRTGPVMPLFSGGPSGAEERQEQDLFYRNLRESLSVGNLARVLPGYQLRIHGSIPRVVTGAFDVRERVIDSGVDASGEPYSTTELTYYETIGGAKEVKHGQAGIGSRREIAIPVDKSGNPLRAGSLNFSLNQNPWGVWEPSINPYVQLHSRMPYQQRASANMEEAAPKQVIAGLTLIPEAMPFGSGSAVSDLSMFDEIGGFSVNQYKYVPLTGVTGAKALQEAVFNIKRGVGTQINPGRGSYRLGVVNIGETIKRNIELEKTSRNLNITGMSLSIAPWYIKGTEGMTFSATEIPGETISTENIARQLEKQHGIRVTRSGGVVPEIVVDYLSSVGPGFKDQGVKMGLNPLISGMISAEVVPGQRVRAHHLTTEVKSMPMAFGQTFAMHELPTQMAIVKRLGAKGVELANWMKETYKGGYSDLEAIALKYGQLTGRDDYNWLQFSAELLNTFKNEKDPMATLRKFGVAYIDNPQWVEGNILSRGQMEEYIAMQREAVTAALSKGAISINLPGGETRTFSGIKQVDDALNALFKYTPIELAPGQTYHKFSFWMNRGLMSLIGTQVAPEMTGWGTLNYRQIASLTERFPETAKLMGISLTDMPLNDLSSGSKQAWTMIKRWETYDLGARTAMSRNTKFIAPDVSDVISITQEKASEIYEKTFGESDFESLSHEERIRRFEQVLRETYGTEFDPSKMLFYSNVLGFTPGTETIRYIDIYDEAGESGAKYTLSYLAMQEKALQAQMAEGPVGPSQAQGAMQAFRTMMSNTMYGPDGTGGKGIIKSIFGYNAPGMIFARYTGMDILNPGELYVPQRELQRMLSEAQLVEGQYSKMTRRVMGSFGGGTFSPEDIYYASQVGGDLAKLQKYIAQKEYPKYVNLAGTEFTIQGQGNIGRRIKRRAALLAETQKRLVNAYLPGFAFRQPDVYRGHVMPTAIVNPFIMAARGVDPKRLPSNWIDAGVPTSFSVLGVGDEDRDPLQAFLAIANGEFIETPEMKRYFRAYKKSYESMLEALGPDAPRNAMRMLFGDKDASYHILLSTIKGYLERSSGEKPAFFETGMSGERVPLSRYGDALEDVGRSKSNMGRTYNMQRLLEASTASLSVFSNEEFQSNIFNPLQLYYQQAIDLSLSESNAMLNVLSTIRPYYSASVGKWRIGASLSGQVSEDQFNWVSPLQEGQAPALHTMLNTLVTRMGREGTLSDATLSYLFAPSSAAAKENLRALTELRRLKSESPEQWSNVSRASILIGRSKLPGDFNPQISEASPYYIATMATAVRKGQEKYGTEWDNLKYQIKIPFKGKEMSMADIEEDPHIFLTNMMYRYQTGKHTNVAGGDIAKAIMKMRELAGGALTQEVIDKLPSAQKSVVSYFRQLLGDPVFNRLTQGEGPIEEQLIDLAREQAKAFYLEGMERELKSKPVMWPSEVAPFIAGKSEWYPEEKMVARRVLLGESTVQTVTGARGLIDRIFPFEGPEGGELFEARWDPMKYSGAYEPMPGAQVGNLRTFVPTERMAFRHTGKSLSLSFDYLGADWHFKPDWLGWDPESKRFHIFEHKMTSSAKHGEYQATLNAIGFREMAQSKDAGIRQRLRSYLKYQFKPLDDSDIDLMMSAIAGGNIDAWLVHKTTGTGTYTNPKSIDWQEMEKNIRPNLKKLIANLKSPDYLKSVTADIIERAEEYGYDMSAVRAWVGDKVRSAPPITPRISSPAVNLPSTDENLFEGRSINNYGQVMRLLNEMVDKIGGKIVVQNKMNLPPKDPQILRGQILGGLQSAITFSSSQEARSLSGRIMERVKSFMDISGDMPFGSAFEGLFNAFQLNPEEAKKAFSDLIPEIMRWGESFRISKTATISPGYVEQTGLVDMDDELVQQGLAILYGKENDDVSNAFNQEWAEYYGMSQYLKSHGIKASRGGSGKESQAPVSRDVASGVGRWVTSNAREIELAMKLAGSKLTPARRKAMVSQLKYLTLQRQAAEAEVEYYQTAAEFKEKFGVNAPTSLEELQAFSDAGTYSADQIAIIAKHKKSLDERHLAMAELISFSGARADASGQFGNFKEISNAADEVNKKLREFVDALKTSGDNIDVVKKKQQEYTTALAEEAEVRARAKLGSILGVSASDAVPRAETRLARYRSLIAGGRELTPEQMEEMEALQSGLGEVGKEQAQVRKSQLEEQFLQEQTRRGRTWGAISRQFLGGFGLMYIQSIGRLMLSGITGGYAEGMKQSEQINNILGGYLGGIIPEASPETRLQRLEALRAGTGYRALRNLQANILSGTPGISNAVSLGTSMISAFGATSYFLPGILEAGFGMSAQAALAATGPVALIAAGLVGTGLAAMNIYGAVSETDKNVAEIASKVAAGKLVRTNIPDVQYIPGLRNVPDLRNTPGVKYALGYTGPLQTLSGIFDWSRWGYTLSIDVQGPMVEKLTSLRDLHRQGMDLESALDYLGITNRAEKERYIRMYSSMSAAEYPNIPIEGLMNAIGFEAQYGYTFSRAPGGKFEQYASALSQGINYSPTVATMLGAAGLSPAAAQAKIPEAVNYLIGSTQPQLSVIQAGAERYAQLGPMAQLPANISPDDLKKIYDPYSKMNSAGFDLFRRYYAIYESRAKRGLDITPPNPNASMFRDVTPQQYAWAIANLQTQEIRESFQSQLYQSMLSSGMSVKDAQAYQKQIQGISPTMYSEILEKEALAGKIRGNIVSYGWGSSWEATSIYRGMADNGFENYSAQRLRLEAAALAKDPQALAMLQAYGLTAGGQEIPFWMVSKDVSLSGMPTGLPLFTTSMNWGNPAQGGIPGSVLMQALFGPQSTWGNIAPMMPSIPGGPRNVNFLSAITNGITLPFKNPFTGQNYEIGGRMAANYLLSNLQYEQAMASAGIQMAQLNLNYAFTTGVGLSAYSGIINPQTGKPFGFNTGKFSWSVGGESFRSQGGGLWGLEDAMRALGYSQQEWGFEMQQRQMELASKHFYENIGLNIRQSQMQRSWAREDWGYQDQIRAMQWQWKQEDFNEEVRFMSGRQRRLAERQMGRETIMYNLEGEQIDKQRDRQKELWELEDERFEITKRQHEEQKKLQEENLKRQKEYFEERKKLEEEQIKLQRAMWTEQMNLQRAAIGVQTKYAEEQKKINDILLAIQLLEIDINAKQEAINNGILDSSTMNTEFWGNVKKYLEELGITIKNMPMPGGGGSGGNYNPSPSNPLPGGNSGGSGPPTGDHKEGDSAGVDKEGFALIWHWDGTKWVKIRKYDTRSGVSLNEITLGQSETSSPWQSTFIGRSVVQDTRPIINLTVNIGNEELGKYVIEAVRADLES